MPEDNIETITSVNLDPIKCDWYHFYQEGMLHIENRLRTQILYQISRNSTLIYQYLLPLCLTLFVSFIILLRFY